MANYSLVVDSKFTPIDYASLLVPIFSNYGTRWNTEFDKALEDYLENLELKSLIEKEEDEELSKIYGNYEKSLNDFYDAFSRGYDSSVEAKGLAANKKYKEVITPIEREFIKREKKIAELDAKRAEDGSYIFDYDYRDAKISDMMKNPNRTYNAIKGSAVLAETSRAILLLAKAYSSLDGANIDKDDTKSLYILTKKRLGYTLLAILDGIEDDPSAPEELKEFKKSIRSRYDYDKLSSENQTQFDYYVDLGYYDGIGLVEKDYISNRNYISQMEQDLWDYTQGKPTSADKNAKTAAEKELKALLEKIKIDKAKRFGSDEGWVIDIKGSTDTGDRLYIARKEGAGTIVSSNYEDFMSLLSEKSDIEGLASSIMTSPNSMFLGEIHETKDNSGNNVYYNLSNFENLDKNIKKYIGRDSQAFESANRFDKSIYKDINSYKATKMGTEPAKIQGAKVINGDDLNTQQINNILTNMIDNNPGIINLIALSDIYHYKAEEAAMKSAEELTINNIADYNDVIQDVTQKYQEGKYTLSSLDIIKYAVQLGMLKLVKIPSRNRDGLGDYFLIKQ